MPLVLIFDGFSFPCLDLPWVIGFILIFQAAGSQEGQAPTTPSCRRRISNFRKDPLTFYVKCRGQVCDLSVVISRWDRGIMLKWQLSPADLERLPNIIQISHYYLYFALSHLILLILKPLLPVSVSVPPSSSRKARELQTEQEGNFVISMLM